MRYLDRLLARCRLTERCKPKPPLPVCIACPDPRPGVNNYCFEVTGPSDFIAVSANAGRRALFVWASTIGANFGAWALCPNNLNGFSFNAGALMETLNPVILTRELLGPIIGWEWLLSVGSAHMEFHFSDIWDWPGGPAN